MLRKIVPIVIAVAFLAGCNDESPSRVRLPTPTPTPALCPILLSCTPLAGADGFYVCGAAPAGSWTFIRNGIEQSVEFGQIVAAAAGDFVQACRPCGCSQVQRLR